MVNVMKSLVPIPTSIIMNVCHLHYIESMYYKQTLTIFFFTLVINFTCYRVSAASLLPSAGAWPIAMIRSGEAFNLPSYDLRNMDLHSAIASVRKIDISLAVDNRNFDNTYYQLLHIWGISSTTPSLLQLEVEQAIHPQLPGEINCNVGIFVSYNTFYTTAQL